MEAISLADQPGRVPASESVLIRAAQEQDHDAFEQLVRLYDRSVLRVATGLLRSEDEARDVYQEVFLRVYRSLHNFRHQCSFHTWLYRIATNVCLDHLRRRSVRKEQALEDDREATGTSLLDTTPAERPESNPERLLAGREVAQKLERALEQLSPKERTVFELKHYEGLRLKTIGEMLSISEEAAKNSLFRATRKLRASLAEVRQ